MYHEADYQWPVHAILLASHRKPFILACKGLGGILLRCFSSFSPPPPPTSLTRSPAEYSICFAACITSTHSRNAIKTPDKQFAHPDKCNENICSAFSALLQVLLHQNRVLSPQRRNVKETTFYFFRHNLTATTFHFFFFSSFSFAAQLLKPCPLNGRTPD